MGSVTGQCLVHKQSPGTFIATVEREHREAIRHYFVTGKETETLTRYLERLHETGRWVICDCLPPETPLEQRPALTVARSQKHKLYLRNLVSREPHAAHCPLRYEPGAKTERETAPPPPGEPQDLLQGALNLHRVAAEGLASSPDRERGSHRASSRTYPRLGQVLLHLMKEAGMLCQDAGFDFLEGIKRMRLAAGRMQAAPGVMLDDVLCLSARQEPEMRQRVRELRREVANAYGVMVVVVHEIETKPLTLVRRGKDGKVEWRCTPAGEVKVWSRRSISKGPFIAAITYAPAPGQYEVVAQHAFVLPILHKGRPLPVESDLERQAASSLVRLIEWAQRQRRQALSLDKPMYDLSVENGQCRPDYLVHGPGGHAVIEVMGMLDDAEYRERKERTVPLMRQLGEVIEIAPPPHNKTLPAEQLKEMNRQVMRTVGARRGVSPRYAEV
jgi:hypothetical protein